MLLKIFAMVVATTMLFIISGISGLLFHVWPTTWPDEELSVTPERLERLSALQREPKFLQDLELYYPGTNDEALRIVLEKMLNTSINHLTQGLPIQPKKSFVLGTFKQVLARSQGLDSEERDRLLRYFNQIMDILEIQSSNELLNVWRYGLPYGWFLNNK